MKKSLLALAVLGAFAGVAQAQSSVTLFGILDVGVGEVRNKDGASGITTARKEMRTDGINSSRLGFRGVEDLGGGMKAGFWLEAGLAPDTGAQGGSNGITTVTFNRRATVSLLGNFGEVRLGRDYTATFWNTTVFDPFGTNGVGALTNLTAGSPLGSGAITLVRDNNMAAYFLPSGIGGVYGQVQVAAGEGNVGNKYQGGRVGYAAGPIDVAVAIGQTLGSNNSDKNKVWNVGGAYSFGPAKIEGLYMRSTYQARRQNVWMLGTVVGLGQGEIHAAYSRSDMSSTNAADASNQFGTNSDAHQLAVGYVYNLSKRTALYGTASRLTNDGASAFTAGGGAGSAKGGTSTGLEAGIRHSF